VDIVALVSVLTSGVVGLTAAAAAFWSTYRTARTAREDRVQQRLAESYLEVLRLVELEALWAKSRARNLWIEAEENYPGSEDLVKMPESPAVDSQAVIDAHLAAFGSAQVKAAHRRWREQMTAVDDEYRRLSSDWRETLHRQVPIGINQLKWKLNELLPKEAAARTLLEEAIAKELDHR